jgi:hypothetical protein
VKDFNLDGIEAHLDKQFASLTFDPETSASMLGFKNCFYYYSYFIYFLYNCIFGGGGGCCFFVSSKSYLFFDPHSLVQPKAASVNNKQATPAPNPNYKPWLELQKYPHDLGVKDLHRTILPEGFSAEPVIIPVKGAMSSEVRQMVGCGEGIEFFSDSVLALVLVLVLVLVLDLGFFFRFLGFLFIIIIFF